MPVFGWMYGLLRIAGYKGAIDRFDDDDYVGMVVDVMVEVDFVLGIVDIE